MVNILITGPPRIGKTTAIGKLIGILPKETKLFGFFTKEIREGGRRVGFSITDLDGKKKVMAHVDFPKHQRVGKYGVDTKSVEDIGVNAIKHGVEKGNVVVVDEIGKMELFSKAFEKSVISVLDSPTHVVATIMSKPNPYADRVKRRDDIVLLEVTKGNRDDIPDLIRKQLGMD